MSGDLEELLVAVGEERLFNSLNIDHTLSKKSLHVT